MRRWDLLLVVKKRSSAVSCFDAFANQTGAWGHKGNFCYTVMSGQVCFEVCLENIPGLHDDDDDGWLYTVGFQSLAALLRTFMLMSKLWKHWLLTTLEITLEPPRKDNLPTKDTFWAPFPVAVVHFTLWEEDNLSTEDNNDMVPKCPLFRGFTIARPNIFTNLLVMQIGSDQVVILSLLPDLAGHPSRWCHNWRDRPRNQRRLPGLWIHCQQPAMLSVVFQYDTPLLRYDRRLGLGRLPSKDRPGWHHGSLRQPDWSDTALDGGFWSGYLWGGDFADCDQRVGGADFQWGEWRWR